MRPVPAALARHAPVRLVCALVIAGLLVAGCGNDDGTGPKPAAGTAPTGTVTLYTSYNQPEVDALLAAYKAARPGVKVEVFRAPTGQLSARIATEERSGGIRGDVLLLSDPLSMQLYAARGLLRRWKPPEEAAVPADARSDTFWGVTSSRVVVVHKPGAAPSSWEDLTSPRYRDKVALPDPNFAGSAFGALGYFALADTYGLDYYRRLKANGAVQVQAPGDVITGVAEGRFDAGMTLDFLVRAAVASGSPVEAAAPEPGAVRLYAPMAVFKSTDNVAAAESFAGFLLTKPAQQVLAKLDRHPIRADVPAVSPEVAEVVPDWPVIFDRQDELRSGYRAIFGG
ncbi:MAG: extracellular solute-binding protein [Sporichthyaceae bacterium]